MTVRTIIPVILSGGSGTRLWPMSRPEMPKQMLALTADQTMLQLTAGRAQGERFAAPIVVANAAHADLVEAQLKDAGAEAQALILEPMGRNTAPAIALAAIAAGETGAGSGDAMLVMPSDHVIADLPAFHAAIAAALPMVAQGWLVTFGIAPDAPETGYGWIQVGEELAAGVHRVAVVPVAMGWNDVGSWDALHAISARDADGNAHRGDGDGSVLAIDTKNCLVRSDGVKVALVGVEDLIVVASGNDVLIMPRGRSQEVKKLIAAMKNR